MDWFSIVVVGTVGFVVAPRIVFALAGAPRPTRRTWMPWLAAAVFGVSWAVPDVDLEGTDTFFQHAVGGGVACAILAYFVAENLRLASPVLRIGLAYVVAATFGVFVEVAEFLWDEFGDTTLTEDTSWDLAANTAGVVVTALAFEVVIAAGRASR